MPLEAISRSQRPASSSSSSAGFGTRKCTLRTWQRARRNYSSTPAQPSHPYPRAGQSASRDRGNPSGSGSLLCRRLRKRIREPRQTRNLESKTNSDGKSLKEGKRHGSRNSSRRCRPEMKRSSTGSSMQKSTTLDQWKSKSNRSSPLHPYCPVNNGARWQKTSNSLHSRANHYRPRVLKKNKKDRPNKPAEATSSISARTTPHQRSSSSRGSKVP